MARKLALEGKLQRLLEARKDRAFARFDCPRQEFATMAAHRAQLEILAAGAPQMVDARIAKNPQTVRATLHGGRTRVIEASL